MKIQTPEQLGAAIRARRKALGLTQKELAMSCGTGLRFLVDLEKGKPTCQTGKALEVLRALGLGVETTPFGGVEGSPMAQLNLNVTPDFEAALQRFMRLRGVRTKSEAIRLAVHEGVERSLPGAGRTSFRAWLGAAAKAELNPHPRFVSDRDLWD